MATLVDIASSVVIQTVCSPRFPDLFRREGSGQAAAPIHQCPDLRFGGRAFRYGLPGILQGADPVHLAASDPSSPALEGSGGVADLGVQFGDDIIAVDRVFAGVHRVWVAPLADFPCDREGD